MKIRKAVITAAGLSTRTGYLANIIPKCMFPIVYKRGDKLEIKPLVHGLLASLKRSGIEEICFVVRGNYKPLFDYINDNFNDLDIYYIHQKRELKEYGGAVLSAKRFVGDEPFVLHADDGLMVESYEKYIRLFESSDMHGLVFYRRVSNPERYGILDLEDTNSELKRVRSAEEKPKQPRSDAALLAFYILDNSYMDELERFKSSDNIQVTYAIDSLAKRSNKVYAKEVSKEQWLNVGDPDSYIKTLNITYSNDISYLFDS
ncbi:MAG: nucleotidyltransferase [Candidatus Micrarchaeota archaeon]|nr:MAG: nucleotidyltransferase [Candidatus Micrarchaeota archaeon]